MKRNFNDLMLSLKKSITPADFFVDFSKVYLNIKDYERHLNLLNSLIGKENIEEEFVDLINEYPEIMKSIPILLATHEYKFHIINASTVENRAYPTGNALLYISLSYVDFSGCVRVGAPCFCFIP